LVDIIRSSDYKGRISKKKRQFNDDENQHNSDFFPVLVPARMIGTHSENLRPVSGRDIQDRLPSEIKNLAVFFKVVRDIK
jgi:hypothetical protein